MSEVHDDDAWLSAFEGKPSNGEPSLHHADQLRNYYLKRGALELSDMLDDASYTRTMNYLRAKGAFHPRAPAPAATQAKTTFWRSVQNWLSPSEGGSGNRYAWIAGLAIVVMALPVVMIQMGAEEEPWRVDESPVGVFPGPATKSSPVPAGPGTAKGFPPAQSNGPVFALNSNDPAQLAQEIRSVLVSRGVIAKVGTNSAGSTVEADIPESQLPQVQQDLLVYGIQIPADGKLRLSLRKP